MRGATLRPATADQLIVLVTSCSWSRAVIDPGPGGQERRVACSNVRPFALLIGLALSVTSLAVSCSQSNGGVPAGTPTGGDTGTPVAVGDAASAGDGTVASPPEAGAGSDDSGSPGDAGTPASDGGREAAPPSTPPQPLLPTTSFYPRAIALADGTILASVVAPQTSGRLGATLLES
ncbi:MAG TPA: hypothetical protein VGI39_36485, partial [Polyangiaceae bacterium]